MKFELCSNFPWIRQHKSQSSNMGSGCLLGTNDVSVQCFPLLSSLANNLLECTEFLSSHQPATFLSHFSTHDQLLPFRLSAMSCWSHTEASGFSVGELCCSPKIAPLWPLGAHPELAHTGWNKLSCWLRWCGHRARMRQFALELPVQSREYYLLVRTPDWETVGTAQTLPLLFGRILGKMVLNPIFHMLKGGRKYFPRGGRC